MFHTLRLPNRGDSRLQLADVIGLTEYGRTRVRAQALVDVRTVVSGGDDDRQPFLQAPQFQRKSITATVGQTHVDYCERKRRSTGDDLQRCFGGGCLDGL